MPIQPENIPGIITSIAALITAMIGVLGTYWLQKNQKKLSEADTADKYQQIADRAATRALRLEERIDRLEKENAELEINYRKVLRDLEIYTRWTERLVHQIQSLGHVPVEKEI